jgi:hypothetical protein
MIRLFKHYIPHAVLLLGLFDFALLLLAGDLAWVLRADQIGMASGSLAARLPMLLAFAVVTQSAMIAVGVFGAEALRSMRFAGARLLVGVSLAVLLFAFIAFVLQGHTFWRSTLLYSMILAIVLLMANRLVVGGVLGAAGSGAGCWCSVPEPVRAASAASPNGREAASSSPATSP